MDFSKITAKELFDMVEGNRRRFLYVSFFGYFEDDDQGRFMFKELDYHDVEFGIADDDQIKLDIEQTEDWEDYMSESDRDKENRNGYYAVEAVFSIQTDGDDFRDWSWYELEHANMHFAHTKEEMDAQQSDIDESLNDLFNF